MAEPVDIILLAYNRLDYLIEMVDALAEHTVWPYRLTIVDNLSGPETRNWLRAHRGRFHQLILNDRNEHLAGYQRGIARTLSELFVVSDADILPHPPTAAGCWLTRLVGLADRHPDFGLISTRLDSITAARDIQADRKRLVDGELIETTTGVWLNLIRRRALRIPYMSDGITSYSIRRSGFRVGVAANVLATHLGDQDPVRHPAYLARKQAASGFGTVYPDYTELAQAARPPSLSDLALAAPVLTAMEAHGVAASDTVELSRAEWPPLAAADPAVESAVKGRARAAAAWSYRGAVPLAPAGAAAVVVICPAQLDRELLDDALQAAGSHVFVVSPTPPPDQPAGWTLLDEQPGLAEPLERLAAIGSTPRWQRRLAYSTTEYRGPWLQTMRAACFDAPARLRVHVFRRDQPLTAAASRWRVGDGTLGVDARRPLPPRWQPHVARSRIGPLVTKAWRLIKAELYLARARTAPTVDARAPFETGSG
jgi:hypothetical protein